MKDFNLRILNNKLAKILTNLFSSETINQLAKKTNFLQRQRKIDPRSWLMALIFNSKNLKNCSLNSLSLTLKQQFNIDVSKEALNKKFSPEAVAFLKEVLALVLKHSLLQSIERKTLGFNKIKIKDSTSFQLNKNLAEVFKGPAGKASEAGIKIQLEFDINTGMLTLPYYTSYTVNDIEDAKNTKSDIKQNQLIMRDLAYISLNILNYIDNKGAFYINRLDTRIQNILDEKGQAVDFEQIREQMKREKLQMMEKNVYIGRVKFPTRLIISLLPEREYQRRFKREYKKTKKKNREISEYKKKKMYFNLYITNSNLKAETIIGLYSLRWQIELVFKIFKSVIELDKVKKVKRERLEVYILSRLIWFLLHWEIYWLLNHHQREKTNQRISLQKYYKYVRSAIENLYQSIKQGREAIKRYIENLAQLVPKYLLLETKPQKGYRKRYLNLCAL